MGLTFLRFLNRPEKGRWSGVMVARGMAAIAATRRASPPRRRKNRHPYRGGGRGCGGPKDGGGSRHPYIQ